MNAHIVESELHVINGCPLYNQIFSQVKKHSPETTNNFLVLFEDNDNSLNSNRKLAEFVYLILEKHKIFNDLYKNNSQDTPHLSSTACAIL